jgi:hypothetical protein
MYDNGAGNRTGIPAAQRYMKAFPEMRMTYQATFCVDPEADDPALNGKSPSALFAMQAAHLCCKDTSHTRRVLFTDNFYTMLCA